MKKIITLNNSFKERHFRKKILLTMLSILCFILCQVNIVFGDVPLGQAKITLHVENKTINFILQEIEKQCDFVFIYNNDNIQIDKVISIGVDNKPLKDVLNDLLTRYNIEYEIYQNKIILKSRNSSNFFIELLKEKIDLLPSLTLNNINAPLEIKQQLTVKGKVTDKNGVPLPGVNILIEGTNDGTITDLDGNYLLNVPSKGTVLIFSFIGYKSDKVTVGNQTDINVQLAEETKGLEEVVVVGYGTQKKSDLTGSVVSVSAEKLKEIPTVSIDQALQGVAPGVLVTQNSGAPGGGISIMIRGVGSVTKSNEPLYIIDGIPVINDNTGTSDGASIDGKGGNGQNTSAMTTINPKDIESIEILKDASASAIYGARAANGVVLITTKRGKAGKTKVSFNSYYGIQELAKQYDVLDVRDYAILRNEMAYNYKGMDMDTSKMMKYSTLPPNTNWQDAIFRKAAIQDYQVSVSGGTEKNRFAISGGFYNQEGIIVNSDFTRYSLRANLDSKVNDRLEAGNSLLVSRTLENLVFTDDAAGVVSSALENDPSVQIYDSLGNFAGPDPNSDDPSDNPLAKVMEKDNLNTKTRVLANVYADLKIFKGLKFRSNLGADVIYANTNMFQPSYQRGKLSDISKAKRSLQNQNVYNWENVLTYSNKFLNRHDLTLLAGNTISYGKYEWLYSYRENFPSNIVQELRMGDPGNQKTEGGAGEWALKSYFGRLNYSFDDKYLLTATIRRDGSSRFGKSKRWGLFPSVSAAWKISSEPFMRNISSVTSMKIRAGYGEVGNQEIGNYPFVATITAVEVGMNGKPLNGIQPAGIPNPEVQWESSATTNLALDLGLFNDRIQITTELYRKVSDKMLFDIPISAIVGGALGNQTVNAGKMENKGFELSLTTNNITGLFNWTTNLNFSVNRNKVLELNNAEIFGQIQWQAVTKTTEGQPVGQFYGHVTDGIFQNADEIKTHAFQNKAAPGDIKFNDLNGDNVIDDKDKTFIGMPFPPYTYGMTNSFSFKGFELTIFMQGVYGNQVYNRIRQSLELMGGSSNQSANVLNRWRGEDFHEIPLDPSSPVVANKNTDTEVPRCIPSDPNNNARISTRFIEDGSYLRIKNLIFAYNIPKFLLDKVKVESLKVYFSAKNIYTFTKYTGYDPELGSFNQNALAAGADNGRYPVPRMMTIGLDLNF